MEVHVYISIFKSLTSNAEGTIISIDTTRTRSPRLETMQALVVTATVSFMQVSPHPWLIPFQRQLESQSQPIPTISDGEILVKVEYVALNPTDYKHRDNNSPPGARSGCDFEGTIVESKSHRPKGQRVAGWVHGGRFEDRGSFAQYLKVYADRVFTVDKLDPASASTFGIGYFTAAMVSQPKGPN